MWNRRIETALLTISAAISPTVGIGQEPPDVKTKVIAHVYEGPSLAVAEQKRAIQALRADVDGLMEEKKAWQEARKTLVKEREKLTKTIDAIKVDHLRLKARLETLENEIGDANVDNAPPSAEETPPSTETEGASEPREETNTPPTRPEDTVEDDHPSITNEKPPSLPEAEVSNGEGELASTTSLTDPIDHDETVPRLLDRQFVIEGAEFPMLWSEDRRGALRKYIRRYLGHTSAVRDVAISPDGDWGASVAGDGSLRLWNLPSSSGHSVIPLLERPLTNVTFAPDGDSLAVAGSGKLFLLDVTPLRVIWSVDTDWISRRESLDFSDDGGLLAVRRQEQLTLFETKTGKQSHSAKLPWNGNFLSSFDLLDDKTLFIAGDYYERGKRIPDDRAKLVNLESGDVLWEIIFPRDPYGPKDIVLMPDRKRIVTAEYHTGLIEVWKVETGSKTTWPETQKTELMELSDSGEILVTAGPGNVTAWHVPTGKIIEAYHFPDYGEQRAQVPDALAVENDGGSGLFIPPDEERAISYCRFRTALAQNDYQRKSKQESDGMP